MAVPPGFAGAARAERGRLTSPNTTPTTRITMGIQNFPPALQPIIQQGFLEREFQQALRSRLGYRAVADREQIAVGIGETLTKTRAGLKPTVTTPLAPATNTNLDNGLTPSNWSVEQY